MSSATLPNSNVTASVPVPARLGPSIVFVGDEPVRIPAWVVDLPTFRRWSISDAFPQSGRIDYIADEIWVDMSMEEYFCHNQVKAKIAQCLGNIIDGEDLGEYIHDRMRLVNPAAGLACEPDWMFGSWETLRTGRLKTLRTDRGATVELEGTPDVVLEVISPSSEDKDDKFNRQAYWAASIPEYWLVDVRKDPLRFEILKHSPSGYQSINPTDGWCHSSVFHRDFRLVRDTNKLGRPTFRLEVR